MSSSEADMMDNTADGELDDDLFGDEEQSDSPAEKVRELSDRELDSGDDDDRNDRAPPKIAEEVDEEGRVAQIMDATVWRHPLPKPADGEFNILRLPKFLGIDPLPYKPEEFKLPESDHHSDTRSANFSASATATSTMRYRKSGSGLESNTVVYKWSDGSTTIGTAEQHYVLQTKPLAPPRDTKPYQEVQDSHSYVASPSIASQLLVLVGHVTKQYTVRPNKDIEDDALEKLQRGLAAATRGNAKNAAKDGPALIMNTQDPELQKKQAEMAEKERLRAQRRRETAAEKALSLGGARRSGIGGLNVDDLEGRSGRRAPGPGRKAPGNKRVRRRPDYDSDDDLPRGGRTREDEYDKEDDFLADSDEELEEGDEEEDEEELDEESDREPKAKKQKTAARQEEDSDMDAEGDLDDEVPAPVQSTEPAARGRKGRHIIEDDEDDE